MGRHSIFDAFQAAAGAADAVLGEIDKQKRAEAAIEIQDAQLKNMEAFNQFMLDVQNSNDWENYEKNWESFKVKAYNEGSKGLSSPYAKRIYESSFKNEEMKQRLMVKGIADQKRRLITVTKGFDSINNLITSNSFQDMEVQEEGGTKFIKTASMQKKEKIDEIAYNLYEAGLLKYDEFNEFQRKAYSTLLTHEMVSAGKKSVDSLMSLEEVNSKMQEFQGEYRLPAGGYVSASALRATAQEEVETYFYKQRRVRWGKAEAEEAKYWDSLLATVMNPALDDSKVGGKSSFEKARDMAKDRLQYLPYLQAQKGDLINPDTAVSYTHKYYDFLQNMDKYIKSGSPLAALGSLDTKKFATVYAEKWKYGTNAYDGKGEKVFNTPNELAQQMISDVNKIAEIKGVPPDIVYPGVIDEFYKQITDMLPPTVKDAVKKYKDTYETLRKAQLGKDKLSPEEQKTALENAGNFVEGLLNVVNMTTYQNLNEQQLLSLIQKQTGKNTAKLFNANTGWWKKESAENTGNIVKQTTQPGIITEDPSGRIVIREEARPAVQAHEDALRRETAIALGLNPNDEKDAGKLSIFYDTKANRIYCTDGKTASYFETNKNGKAILKTVDWKTKEVKTTEKLSEEVRKDKKEAKEKEKLDNINKLINEASRAESMQRDIKPFFENLKTEEDKKLFLEVYNEIEKRGRDKNIGGAFRINKQEVINAFNVKKNKK